MAIEQSVLLAQSRSIQATADPAECGIDPLAHLSSSA
jgi:hypothetical protein